ncbi:hypothetical protein ACHMWU_12880 [Aeromicrobium sp. UC242_57]
MTPPVVESDDCAGHLPEPSIATVAERATGRRPVGGACSAALVAHHG